MTFLLAGDFMYMDADNSLDIRFSNRPASANADALLGFTEAEAFDWADSLDAELAVDYVAADYEHLVGIVLSATPADDGRVAIVVGKANPDTEIAGDLTTDFDHDEVGDELDAFFSTTAFENEQLAAPACLEEDTGEVVDSEVEDDFVDEDVDQLQEAPDSHQPPSRRRSRILIACLLILAVVGVTSLLTSSSTTPKTVTDAAAALPTPPSNSQAKSTTSGAVKKPARRKARSSKRRRAHARRSTPQAAPRPVVPVTRPAAPVGGGSCGSAASEMTFEC